MAGCGFLGDGDDPMVMTDPPSIGGSGMEGPVPRPTETPSVTGVEEMTGDTGSAAVMRTPLPDGGHYIGIAVSCSEEGAAVTVSMGPFPADFRPVQLAVRTIDGDLERFGPVLKLGIEHGFHSPTIEDGDEVERFLGAALDPGALVSNGFYSFFNEGGEAAAEAIREFMGRCSG